VESSYKPSFGVVAITTPSRLTSTLAEVACLHLRRTVFIPPTFFPWALSVIGPGVGVTVGEGVGVGVGVGKGVGVGVGVGVGAEDPAARWAAKNEATLGVADSSNATMIR